ncbi:MAG: hypothetical protein DWH82_08480 [Planctomycetota bacterium]|nr:MAG: hypothetical protein DWH82_08480 [Planctomycetota bacterium]
MERTLEMPVLKADRRHDLDALRAFAMLLGIGYHAALSFGGTPWLVTDNQNSVAFHWFIEAVHGFRMQLFFLVSGYFTALLLARRGLGGMLKNRAARILVPCLLGLATLIPLNNRVTEWAMAWNASHSATPLIAAITQGDAETVTRLLEVGADIEQTDSRFKTRPLGWAVLYGNEPMTRLLLDHGASAKATTADGSTPLSTAAFLGRIDLLKLLVERGGDCLAANKAGITPLMSTFADVELTNTILKLLTGNEPADWGNLDKGRNDVRLYLGTKAATSGLAAFFTKKAVEKDAPSVEATAPKPSEVHPWLTSYARYLASEQFRITVGPWKFQLFEDPTMSYLWFLWFLVWLVLIYGAFFWAWSRVFPAGSPRGLPLIPSLILAIGLTLAPQWFMDVPWFPGASPTGAFGPDTAMGIIPKPHMLVYYGIFFFFGSHYQRLNDRQALLGQGWWLMLPLALLGIFPIGLATLDNRALNAPVQVLFTWLMTVGMIGMFHTVLNRENPFRRYLSDSSYWLYLAHLPLVIAGQAFVCDWQTPAVLKFLLVNGVSILILLATYQILVRHTWLGLVLNGPQKKL